MSSNAAFSAASFSAAEWGLLVHLPQWVARAASAAQPDNARRTAAESEAGLVLISYGRQSASPLVGEIADHLVAAAGSAEEREMVASVDFADKEAGVADVLERAQNAARLLDAKADRADATAYRQWLLTIADVVVKAARSGDVLGLGGQLVTAAEHSFYDRLAVVLAQ